MKFLPLHVVYKGLLSSFILIFVHSSFAAELHFYRGSSLKKVKYQTVHKQVTRADVLIIGEHHDSQLHHEQQAQLLHWLSSMHGSFHLGMEFFSYDQQPSLDAYLKEEIDEAEFLQQVRWQGYPFSEYREQVLSPLQYGGWTYGINLPRWVAREISTKGLVNISAEAKAYLPPQPQLGNPEYFQRFRETMVGHVPEEAIQSYFEAQSMWDDTMAWKAAELIKTQKFLAIIVGEFHVAYGGGLPERISKRSPKSKVLTLSQLGSCEELVESKKSGERADFILLGENCEGPLH